jgi:hypothetical protein
LALFGKILIDLSVNPLASGTALVEARAAIDWASCAWLVCGDAEDALSACACCQPVSRSNRKNKDNRRERMGNAEELMLASHNAGGMLP